MIKELMNIDLVRSCTLLIGLTILLGCRATPNKPNAKTEELLAGSQQALKEGNLQMAYLLADSAVSRAPGVAEVHFHKGRVLTELSQYNQAQTSYKKALDRNPNFDKAWFNLGNNASRQQKFRNAISFYKNALEEYPIEARISIGRAYNAIGKSDSAEWAYKQALKRDSLNASAHAWLSLLYKDQGKRREALQHSRKASELQPKNVDYMYFYGAQLMVSGKVGKAVDYLQKVIVARPWHYGAYHKLGQALARQGKLDSAKQVMARADTLQQLQSDIVRQRELIQMAPEDPENWAKLGNMLREVGRYREAENVMQTANSLRN